MDKSRLVTKTNAKAVYCLADKDLEGLEPVERRNPRARNGPPMKLYEKEALERLAAKRWGSLAGLEAERAKRQERRQQRSILAYLQQPKGGTQGGGSNSGTSGAAGDAATQAGEPYSSTSNGGEATAAASCSGQQRAAQALPAAQDDWRAGLRQPLAQRICLVPRSPPQQQQPAVQPAEQGQQGGRYILYWMQTAVRVHENPALDAAVHASHRLGLPLVVAAFLLASHPFATARRYKFLLEGLRDMQSELRRQGGELLVYLEGHTEPQEPVVSAAAFRAGAGASAGTGQAAGATCAGPSHAGSSDDSSCPSGVAAALDRAIFTGPASAGDAAASEIPAGGGSPFLFHPPPGFQRSVGWRRLVQLSRGAAVVLTEDMPAPPLSDWLLALASELPASVQLAAVDTHCVLPMRSVGRSFDKAYAFRSATSSQRQAAARATYTLQTQPGSLGSAGLVGPGALAPFQLSGTAQQGGEALAQLLGLPWSSLELAGLPEEGLHEALCKLLAGCGAIYDQAVPPVSHMVGGSRAGYARWEDFRRRGLALYAARRNDALQRDGVSRLSAYHHWGMVSPFKVAREAALDKSGGASKYLDEFLTWRELSYVFCLHLLPQLHSVAALPKWAQQTLARHGGDPRQVKPLPNLAAGRTGDAFWDAAQSQLVTTGELHNNSRMTWGKALLGWTASPLTALRTALHLNHLFALDGCNPCSYSGVLWCFGLFDGPKASESTPVSGCLAARPTSRHAQRLNPAAYRSLPA